ncbi:MULTISPECIES: hypothetical protein [Eikenella]|uniref:Uncharacterized protein n=1 Tax=Eikenella exigua TaxID=2528037 RepID=A0AAX1F7M0_9NEIS|nr:MULTISPECIES: hypothetical protein [Eikenella]OAM28680.1 hypothetical protein A7P94_01255 [Eikenella sp. NML01-A-086]OAM41192.1 hypothetical protein A7Q02_07715 [Eikenella sp. NML97-A-109]QED92101.1 hypothetical protein EZJ17_05335 [Eikenella exigua]
MQAIKLALILSTIAMPLAGQAKQPAPARQAANLPRFIRSINQKAPIESGPITIRRAAAQGRNILIDAAIDSQLLPLPPAVEREPTRQALQTLAEASWCHHPQFPALNQTRNLTTRYTISGETAPISITIPAGRCAQIQSSQNPAQQEENSQIAALILLIPGMNQRLPLTEDKLTLQRVRFDHTARTMHKYLTLNDPELTKQPVAQIRTKLQTEARALVCEDPLLAQSNLYYPTTHHFTLTGHPETFKAAIAKNSCTQTENTK